MPYPSAGLFPGPSLWPGTGAPPPPPPPPEGGGGGGGDVVRDDVVITGLFFPPTQEVYVRMAGRGLFAAYEQGLTVYRVFDLWLTKMSPTFDELAQADRIYAGGYVHPVTDAKAAELIAAGFSVSPLPTPPPVIDTTAVVGSAVVGTSTAA